MKKKMMNSTRVGLTNTNIYGEEYIITEYINNENVYITFPQYEYTRKVSWRTFEKGKVTTPFSPTIYGHGYIGVGEYSCTSSPDAYTRWQGILRRCYDKQYQMKKPTYLECMICDEWLNFQNFMMWYNQNYYTIENTTMHLDKDILTKGNKIYSSDTCVFVPSEINALFTKTNAKRGVLPIGVDLHRNKYRATMNVNNKHIHLGVYDSMEEAFAVYKRSKEDYIKEIADSYKIYIPDKLYTALYEYEVEWED